MKKLVIVIIIGLGIWWGFTRFSRDSGKGHETGGTISEGEQIDLKKYLEPDKYTTFFFYANW